VLDSGATPTVARSDLLLDALQQHWPLAAGHVEAAHSWFRERVELATPMAAPAIEQLLRGGSGRRLRTPARGVA
jgi:hypothetical protein